jgi:hypothetical protein
MRRETEGTNSMTVLAFESAFAPPARPRQRRHWWHFWRRPTAPQPAPRRSGRPDDVPDFLRREQARTANVRPIPGKAYVRPSLDVYAPKLEPAPEPIVEPPAALDPLADLKLKLRTLTYGDFMVAVEGMGFDPDKAWKWATT